MKCDNLQRYSVDIDYVPNDDGAYMDADEVNEAIAELKQKLAEKDKEIALLKERICNGDVSRSTWIDDCIAKDKEIDELKKKLMPCLNGDCILTCEVVEKYGKENAELKAKLEDVQASMYAEMVDVGMENRRLKRALWLARAQAADGFATISRWTDYEDLHPDTKMGYRKWFKNFMHAKALCKAKAEEYK